MNERARALAVAGAMAVCLIAGSAPRIVGDGAEYLAQAMNFAALHGPWMGRQAIREIQPRIHQLEPALADWSIELASVPSADRSRDFSHFWFYALLTTPALWLVTALGAAPAFAFTLTNLALLGLALWCVLPKLGVPASALLFASPLVWWIDKAHTEVFTVALLSIAFVLMREKPGWALIAAGMAATQNLPVAVVFVSVLAVEVFKHRGRLLDDRGLAVGALIGGALVCLHPVYTYTRHGTASLLLNATRSGWPTLAEFSAVLADPTLGLIGNAPLLLLGTASALLILMRRSPRVFATREMLVAAVSMLVFLYAFAQTANTHHGATTSLSRYALWLIPLAIPAFAAMLRDGGRVWRAFLMTCALASSAVSVFAFHPGVPEKGREPTWLATWIWTRHPTWHNPLPEVFSETVLGVEGTAVPAATGRCEKMLLSPWDPEGAWPVPCYPGIAPAECRVTNATCYANRVADGYLFARPPGREPPPLRLSSEVWPIESEPHVRALFDEWHWWTLSATPASIATLRAHHDVRASAVGSDDRFIVVLRPRGPKPVVRLRPRGVTLSGKLVDARSGETLQALAFSGVPGDLWNIEIPADRGLQILALVAGAPDR